MAKRGLIAKQEIKEKDRRPIRWRKYPHLFLIVCEDEKTEPYYFEGFIKEFPEETVYLRAIGTGRNSKGVVEQSIVEKTKLAELSNKIVDEVWAVFDKDDAEKSFGNAERFKEAFRLAREVNHKVAYSNEVFELWVLLHFTEISSVKPIPRNEIYKSISDIVKSFPGYEGFEYQHGNTEIIDVLTKVGNEEDAIGRAQELLRKQAGIQPLEANPSTTVHILVRRLRELIAYYSYIPE
jgi:hypothetical protein